MHAVVVVPTYQEAGNIAALLRQIRAAAPSVRVIVVDDDSPDGTADIAEATGADLGGVTVVRRTAKEGLGAAYRAGFALALDGGADVVVSMDADLSHDPAALPSLIGAVEEGADLALGSRYVPGGSVVNWPTDRRVLSRWGNRYATAALGLPVDDATSGYRAYRASVVRQMGLGRARASGYGFLIEMVYRVASSGNKIVETPIAFVDRRWGQSKMSTRSVVEAAVLVTLWGARDRLRSFGDRRRFRYDGTRGDHREYQRTFYDRHYPKRVAAVREQLAHPLFRSFYDRLGRRVYDHALDGGSEKGVVRVLEPGCGEGLLGAALQRVAEERQVRLEYTGGDISEAALGLAREHVVGELHVGDATEVAARLRSGSQDVVVLKNLLHHLDDPAALLREAARVAGASGKVVIVEPRLGCPHIWVFNLLAPRRERHYFKGQRRNLAALRAAGLVLSRRERFTWLPYELAFVIRPGLFRRLFSTDDPDFIRRVSELDDRLVAALPWLATYVLWVAVPASADGDDAGTKRS